VIESLSLAQHAGLPAKPHVWRLRQALMDFLWSAWREPDEGLWEVRGPRRHFVHSKVMAWVAADRTVRTLEENPGLSGDVDRWRAMRDEVHREVCERGYDPERNTFTQSYGSRELDAALLLIPRHGFLPPDDPRVVGTVRAVESHLLRDGFVARYDAAVADDGIAGAQEGTFLFCSFWLIDAYVLLGRHDDALALFERLRVLQNDVGLLAEEYDPVAKTALGNFPQAFSHVGLIIAALNLARAVGPAAERTSGGEGAGPSA
jgi:GH15 family glucan-1,4-alpha-glucosidase